MESSWSKIESDLLSVYTGEADTLDEDNSQFLSLLEFTDEEGDISKTGKKYLDSKHIYENGNHETILRDKVLGLPEIRELCQSFYGQKTARENVELFFQSKTEVADKTEIGRILGLLNSVDIVSYNKRKGTVQFKGTDQVEELDQESYRITHRTPFSNIIRFRKCLRACEGDVFWIDAHFTKKGLEPLAEEATGDKFNSVRILCGPAHVASHMRDDFDRFQEEMENRDIDAELRVITSEEVLRSLHDRWVLSSDGASWNVPPINSLYGNQEAEIHKTDQKIDFEDWWDDAENIMEDWNNIQPYIDE